MSEETEKIGEAKNLDYWTRNRRLYETLLSFGLWVEPVFADSPIEGDIDYLRVSVGQAKGTDGADDAKLEVYRPSGGCSAN